MMGQPAFSTESPPPNSSVTDCSKEGNVIYLAGQNPVPNTKEKEKSIQAENTSDFPDDIKSMTATQLQDKYSSTYNSWKNMKQRCKNNGYILDPRFATFRDFLHHMGPRPNNKFTLDRVDSENPNYGPEHCRWADKHTQNQNKGNNVHLTYKGKTDTVSVWAKKTKQKANTLYHRKAQGWTDEEVITGLRNPTPAKSQVRTIRVSALTIGQLIEHLDDALKTKRAIQEEMEFIYNLDGPEARSPAELVARREKADTDYWTLLNEVRRRSPNFDVVAYFRLYTSR